MKKVYVVNLDKKRILILSGAILSIVGAAFFMGSQQSKTFGNTSDHFESMMQTNDRGRESDSAMEPLEDIPFEENAPQTDLEDLSVREDPFLSEPRQPTKPAFNTQKPSDSSSPERYYTIQLGAYKHEKDAIRFQNELKQNGVEARVDRGILYYYVRAGKSRDKTALESLYKKIHDNLKLEAIVVYRKIS